MKEGKVNKYSFVNDLETAARRKVKLINVLNFYCCVMYSGVEYVVCCYFECISHTRQAEKSACYNKCSFINHLETAACRKVKLINVHS